MHSEVFELSDEIQAIQESINRRMYPFEMTASGAHAGPCAAIYEADFGIAGLTRIHSHVSFSGHRCRPSSGEGGGYSVALVEDGASINFEGRRVGVIQPGSIYLIGSHHYPFETELKAAGTSLAVTLPYSLMRARFPQIDDWCLRPIDTSNGSASVLRSTMTSMWQERTRIPGPARAALIEALLALVGAAFDDEAPAPAGTTRSTEFHMLRLRALVDSNLANPGLTPDLVADELGISRSYLFKLLSKCNATFSGMVIERRLERSRMLLSDPASAGRTIGEIAASVGFADAAHFCHRFSRRYGKSPRAFRVDLVRGRN